MSEKTEELSTVVGVTETELRDVSTPPPSRPSRRGAYRFLLAASVVEAVLWGFPLTFGVFQAFYSTSRGLGENAYLPVTGMLAIGIPFIGGPLATALSNAYPPKRQLMVCLGVVIDCLALIAASFATKAWHIILTQGVLYGLGFLLLYYPLLSQLNEWFDEDRGLAYGLLFAANGLGGAVLPIIIEHLLLRYGSATTLRAFAIAAIIIVGPMLPLFKGSPSYCHDQDPQTKQSILREALFWPIAVASFFQGIAYNIPFVYLPSYALELHISSTKATLLLTIMNITTIVGQIMLGSASDRVNACILLIISSTLTAIAVCTLWLFGTHFPHLIAFAVVYGLLAGGFNTLYARLSSMLDNSNASAASRVYGLLAFVRGLGYVISGPICGALVGAVASGNGGRSAYHYLILFDGTAFGVCACGGIGWFLTRSRQKQVVQD